MGAGGLWPDLERAARDHDSHVQLTHNVRAEHPADRRDQAHFRSGQHEQALRGYAARGRVTLSIDQQQAEDTALEAAHADRQAGKNVLVIAQTSNDHLDALNARAQAICLEHGELGASSVPVTGRLYRLHAGDHIQIRCAINHPDLGQLRNRLTGEVIAVTPDGQSLRLHLDDERNCTLDRGQLDRADVRLSYVQHPFPAQGRTTDTTHLIVAEHATQEGSYVALTRARERTHIHASREELDDEQSELLVGLAEHMSRTEPDIPSIRTPLLHETEIHVQHTLELADRPPALSAQHELESRDEPSETPDGDSQAVRVSHRGAAICKGVIAILGPRPGEAEKARSAWEHAAGAILQYRSDYEIAAAEPLLLGPAPPAGAFQQRYDRRQAATAMLDALDQLNRPGFHRGPINEPVNSVDLVHERPDRDLAIGWEL